MSPLLEISGQKGMQAYEKLPFLPYIAVLSLLPDKVSRRVCLHQWRAAPQRQTAGAVSVENVSKANQQVILLDLPTRKQRHYGHARDMDCAMNYSLGLLC